MTYRWKDMKAWQKKRLLFWFIFVIVVAVVYLTACTVRLYSDRIQEDDYWDSALTTNSHVLETLEDRAANAVPVQVGTYIENLKEISIKNSYYRTVMQVWFRWEGDADLDMANSFHVYKGYINKTEVLKDYHENGVNYQLVRIDVTVTKNYWTCRFPLESHQLRCYIESNYPAREVVFTADKENSGLNQSMSIAGFDIRRYDTGIFYNQYDSTHGDPTLPDPIITAEHVTALELNRSSIGLYIKCIIALFGTSIWVLITLFICTFHYVDPLGMIPAALFGTVSNIMVGANLLPDALELGLLEFINAWGIYTILIVALAVININRIRNKYEDREFAHFFGRIMFTTILVFTVIGHILLPVSAYMLG